MKIQAISGLAFATFLVLHLANFATAMFGQATYDAFMRTMRFYYQFPLVEIVCVLSAAAVHVWSGITRILRRRRRAKKSGRPTPKPTWRIRLHRWSGYYIMAVLAGHIAATRGPGLFGHPADLSFLNFSLTALPAFFYPYYLLLAFSGLYHMTHGSLAALRIVGVKLPAATTSPRSRVFWAWTVCSAAIAVVGVLAIGGHLYTPDTTRFPEWLGLYNDLVGP